MQQISVEDAKKRLEELMDDAASGHDVIITRGDGATFKIVPARPAKPQPVFGSGRGIFKISEDFDDPLEDFASTNTPLPFGRVT